ERSLGEFRRRTKSWDGSPARPAASHSSGRYSTCSSATPATAPRSPTSTANTSTESNTSKPTPTPSTRRPPPPRLNHGNLNRKRIYSGKGTQPPARLEPRFARKAGGRGAATETPEVDDLREPGARLGWPLLSRRSGSRLWT